MLNCILKLKEWLVIAPDLPDAMEKRLAVRQKHLGGLKEDPETFWLWGGTYLLPYENHMVYAIDRHIS
jgi:hypothetical protein